MRRIASLKKYPILVASMGRCGTQLIQNCIRTQFESGTHVNFYTDNPTKILNGYTYTTHSIPSDEQLDLIPSNTKVLFLYGNPMDSVLSTSKMANWKDHVYHLTGRRDISLEETINEDLLNFEKFFDYWYRNHKKWDVLAIRYDTIYQNMDKIYKHLGIRFNMPPYKKRKTDWIKSPRKEELLNTYKNLHEKILNSESKIFKKIDQ